ncbi:hypothetical protein BGZ52_010267 [Haplosporangium bisporale]|nr:hypothetical protein BGZ52_010267 [Haplosporangium bisporale]
MSETNTATVSISAVSTVGDAPSSLESTEAKLARASTLSIASSKATDSSQSKRSSSHFFNYCLSNYPYPSDNHNHNHRQSAETKSNNDFHCSQIAFHPIPIHHSRQSSPGQCY